MRNQKYVVYQLNFPTPAFADRLSYMNPDEDIGYNIYNAHPEGL